MQCGLPFTYGMYMVYPLQKVCIWSILYIWYVCGLLSVYLTSTTGWVTHGPLGWHHSQTEGRLPTWKTTTLYEVTGLTRRIPQTWWNYSLSAWNSKNGKLSPISEKHSQQLVKLCHHTGSSCVELSCLDTGKLFGTKPKRQTNVWMNPGVQTRSSEKFLYSPE